MVLELVVWLGSKFSELGFLKKRKIDEMLKSYRRPDYTKQSYGLCLCICVPYSVSYQIKFLTKLTHSDFHLPLNV
jgi:hypothetical protein